MHSPSGDADVIPDAGLPGEHDGRITKRDGLVLLCIRSELPQHLVAVSGLWSRRVPPLASCRFLAAALQWNLVTARLSGMAVGHKVRGVTRSIAYLKGKHSHEDTRLSRTLLGHQPRSARVLPALVDLYRLRREPGADRRHGRDLRRDAAAAVPEGPDLSARADAGR